MDKKDISEAVLFVSSVACANGHQRCSSFLIDSGANEDPMTLRITHLLEGFFQPPTHAGVHGVWDGQILGYTMIE